MTDDLQNSIDRGDLAQAWEIAHSRFETCHNSGRPDEAMEFAELCVDLAQREFTAPHAKIALSFTNSGLALWLMRKPRQGARMLRRGLKMQQEVFRPLDPEVGNTMMSLAVVLCDIRQYEEAEQLLGQALQIFTRRKRTSLVGDAHYNMAKLYAGKNLNAKARTHFEHAIAVYSRTRNVAAYRKAAIRVDLAELLLKMHRPKDAEPLLRAAHRIHAAAAAYNNRAWIAEMLHIIDKRIAVGGKLGLNTGRLERRKEALEGALYSQRASVWVD